MAAAAVLGRSGEQVTLFEKNETIGGRASVFSEQGFLFDRGPSWYWMPDVFERFFAQFGHAASDFYHLELLDPSFTIIFSAGETVDVPASYPELRQLFETLESGAAEKLDRFMRQAELKYRIGMDNLVYKPGLSVLEFCTPEVIFNAMKLQVFSSFSKHVRSFFKDSRLVALLEFPVLFLGAQPSATPALYSLMNYAGLKLGTWYPMGGFGKVAEAFRTLGTENNVAIHTGTPVSGFTFSNSRISGVTVAGTSVPADVVIGSADYAHVESLLPREFRTYSDAYWDSRTLSPSCLIFYLGVSKKLEKLRHHNLFFDEDLEEHGKAIYQEKAWPDKPLFYVCCPSKTDPGVAPEGMENLFILMPVAPGITDTETVRERYFALLLQRLESYTGENIRDALLVKQSYCINDFKSDYNALKGNAYGLANTLAQTAVFKPSIRSKKVSNLFFAGQLTVPGPGVPPAIISGEISAKLVKHYLSTL